MAVILFRITFASRPRLARLLYPVVEQRCGHRQDGAHNENHDRKQDRLEPGITPTRDYLLAHAGV